MLLVHISIALTSVIISTLTLLHPTQRRLNIGYAFIAGTLTTGTALVVMTHSPILSSCLSGLTYTLVVTVEAVLAQRKLARQNISD